MKISLIKTGKRYNREWIFRNFSYEFVAGISYAITGPNGSGKSTLLQAIGGALMLSEGEVLYETDVKNAEPEAFSQTITNPQNIQSIKSTRLTQTDNIYNHLSIAAPYLELIEEMTVVEFLRFHEQFKPLLPSLSIDIIIETVGLGKSRNKQMRYYSSGMKQRVKLAQAIFSDVPVILLDEPCTNLDSEGIALYKELINNFCKKRLVIVSSNDTAEYEFCKEHLNITNYK